MVTMGQQSNDPTTPVPTVEVRRDEEGDEILGDTRACVEVPWGQTTAKLSMTAEVTQCQEFGTRRRFFGTLYINVDGVKHMAGTVGGYHILKPNKTSPDRNKKAWVADWLKKDLNSYEPSPQEMAFALHGLYMDTEGEYGKVRKQRGSGKPYAAGLNHTDDMFFIQKIFIKEKYNGRGLLKHALYLLHRCLTSPAALDDLPAAHLLTEPVTYFLEPGVLDHPEEKAKWNVFLPKKPKGENGTLSELQEQAFNNKVVNTLIKIYTSKSIGFSVHVRNIQLPRGVDYLHTILVRRVVDSAPAPGAVDASADDTPLADDDDDDEGDDDEPKHSPSSATMRPSSSLSPVPGQSEAPQAQAPAARNAVEIIVTDIVMTASLLSTGNTLADEFKTAAEKRKHDDSDDEDDSDHDDGDDEDDSDYESDDDDDDDDESDYQPDSPQTCRKRKPATTRAGPPAKRNKRN